jgi:hypothetical protein
MIVCPNCNHPNPDGAVQCEACYTPLPATINCPSCGATVQADAAFCGQCGYNLHSTAVVVSTPPSPNFAASIPVEIPSVGSANQIQELLQPEPLGLNIPANSTLPPTTVVEASTPVIPVAESFAPVFIPTAEPEVEIFTPPETTPEATPEPITAGTPLASVVQATSTPVQVTTSKTQLQQVTARLFHVQSNQELELPQNLSVIHIGKPNDRIPPDIDVAGFANSEIVSRIHADIRIEGDNFYLEDVGSSNGSYVNNLPLPPGNRHRLRPGDRISLGKGDLVTFLFQLS